MIRQKLKNWFDEEINFDDVVFDLVAGFVGTYLLIMIIIIVLMVIT